MSKRPAAFLMSKFTNLKQCVDTQKVKGQAATSGLPILLAILVALVCAVPGRSQANINEGLETASVYVDTVNGSDSNPGTATQPLKTIGASVAMAEANNANNIGTTVIINPGTYRESVSVAAPHNSTAMPITFEAATNGTVTVSGAQAFTGWQPYSGNSSIYTTAWPYAWGDCNTLSVNAPAAPEIVLRREIVFVNGAPMTQVLSLAQVTTGTFYVDETSGAIYMWPPTGTDVGTADVEVGVLPSLWTITQSNIVVRGLTFEYANSCRENPAVTVLGSTNPTSNILFDTDSFLWNNAQGIALQASLSYFTVQNSTFNHNGESGIQANEVTYGLLQSDTSNYNNWRGGQGAYYTWNAGGNHLFQMHNLTLNSVNTNYNQTYGVHFDTDNYNINNNSAVSYANVVGQMFVEVSEGPVTISNSSLCTGSPSNFKSNIGLVIRNSENISVTNSNIVNPSTGIWITGIAGGIPGSNWETGEQYNLVSQNITFNQNVIETGSGQQVFNDSLDGADWTTFQTSLNSNNNTWWNASNTTPFTVPLTGTGVQEAFAGWQSATGQDSSSAFVQPSGNPGAACSGSADMTDYWFVVPFNASPITINPQASGTITASIVPLLNFSGSVNLTYDGVQNIPGASASWSPTSVTSGNSSNFTLTPSQSTPPGTYPVTLIANSGSQTHTITVLVTIDSTVQLSTTSLGFANQLVNTSSSSQTVNVTNVASTPLSITSISISGANPGDFSETNNCPSSLATNASCTVTVTFTPATTGSLTATMHVNDSDATSPQSVALSGTGTQPSATLSPSTLSFGNQVVGVVSAPLVVNLTNTGTASLTITSVAITGSNVSDFAQTNNCGSTVAVGATCTFNVTFDPPKTGSRAANLKVTDNTSNKSQTVSLSGTGIQSAVTLSPSTLAFGSQIWGTTSAAKTTTVTNSGSSTLNITSITLTGAAPGDYSETNTCGSTLAVSATCTITATFKPTADGSRTANITITDNTSNASQNVSLTGTGATSVSYSPKSITFTARTIGTTSGATKVTLTNLGSALSITGITITGTNAGDFAETNTCGSSLAAGANCNVSVTFTPLAAGTRTANVNISDSDPTSPQVVTLTGTGNTAAAATLTPSSLTFASQVVGTPSAVQNLTLTSTGSASLSITSVTVTGSNTSDYSQTNNCGTTLAMGATCTISVTFNPTKTGTRTATITVTDSASSTQTASLTGTGIQAAVTFSPSSLNFGSQIFGTTSATSAVTVTNSGSSTLNITAVSLTGSNPGDFAETNNCGSAIAVNGTCTINVTFTPTADGSRTASVSLSDNGASSPQTLSLNGTGSTSVSYSPKSITFTSQNIGNTSGATKVTVTNLGNTLSIQNITITGTNASDFAQTNTCGTSVPVGGNCTISVTFTPTAAGTRTASLSVYDPDPTSPQVLSLTGTGNTAAAATLTPSSLAFGNQVVGTPSAVQTLTLTSTGSAALSITNVAVTGSNTADFSQTNNCPASLAIGSTCNVSVTFDPTKTGSRSATITVTDNGTPTTQTASLTGTGLQAAVTLSPSSLYFGSVIFNTSSMLPVTLTNSGTSTLNITSFTVTGSDPGDYSQTNNCGSSVAVNASCTINVTFLPVGINSRTATLNIFDNTSTGSQTVSLNGSGSTSVTYTPKSITFSARTVGTTSGVTKVTLTNLGNALTISSIAFTGADPGDFNQTNTCGSVLAAGANCTISVTFTPTATGTRTGNLTITDNDPTSPQQVTLTGTGQ